VPIRIGVRTDWVGLSVARCGNVALPEPVTLGLFGIVSRPLPVDLVVNVAHRDEGSDHTRPTTSFDPGSH